jgi:hypothetical protein
MAKKSTERVQRFRQRMRDIHAVRLEVTVAGDVAESLRKLAHVRDQPLYQLLERAVELLEADTGNTAT